MKISAASGDSAAGVREGVDLAGRLQLERRELGRSLDSLIEYLSQAGLQVCILPLEARQDIEAGQLDIPESFWAELAPLVRDWSQSGYIQNAL